MSDGFVMQPSYYESLRVLPNKDRLEMYDAICNYGLYGTEPQNLKPSNLATFISIKPTIDASKRRYSHCVENGKKGGAPKGNQNAKKQGKNNQRTTKEQGKNNLNIDINNNIDKDIDIDKDNIYADKPPRTRFIPPTIDEVKAYCIERGNTVDAEHFIDYYTANGWQIGKNKMKDWKAAVRTWERNGIADTKPKGGGMSANIREEDYKTDVSYYIEN